MLHNPSAAHEDVLIKIESLIEYYLDKEQDNVNRIREALDECDSYSEKEDLEIELHVVECIHKCIEEIFSDIKKLRDE